jgi:hypothetical protein
MPEVFARKDEDGKPFFEVPAHDVTSYDYLMKVSNREAPLTDKVDITNFANFANTPCVGGNCSNTVFDLERYLVARGDTRITNWAAWVANAKFKTSESTAGAQNWIVWKDHHAPGKAERLARSQVGRMALQRMMLENDIDAFVHAENTVPTPKIQGPNVGAISLDGITPFLQIPRIAVPAGVTDVVYEPVYALDEKKTDYVSVLPPDVQKGKLKHPMPISITFFAGQGDEPTLIKIGSAYEAATHHRFPPPMLPPLKAGPSQLKASR